MEVAFFFCVCLCVCVCLSVGVIKREREREGERYMVVRECSLSKLRKVVKSFVQEFQSLKERNDLHNLSLGRSKSRKILERETVCVCLCVYECVCVCV